MPARRDARRYNRHAICHAAVYACRCLFRFSRHVSFVTYRILLTLPSRLMPLFDVFRLLIAVAVMLCFSRRTMT